MVSKEQIHGILDGYAIYRGVQANEDIAFQACKDAEGGQKAREIIDGLINRGQLSPSQAYRDSMATLESACPSYFPSGANELLLKKALGDCDPNWQNILTALRLVQNDLCLNQRGQAKADADYAREKQEQADLAQFAKDDEEADAIIAELLQPMLGPDGNLRRYSDGSTVPYSKFAARKAELEAMSITALRAEIAPIRERERIEKLSPVEYRKETHQTQTTARRLTEMYDARYPVIPPEGYEVPGSATLQNGLTPTFIPWSLKLIQVLEPEVIKGLIRRYGAPQIESACRSKE